MFTVKPCHIICAVLLLAVSFFAQATQPVAASPFGQGQFGIGQFGDRTSLIVSLGGDVSFTADNSGFPTIKGYGSHTIDVTSTAVAGYSIYAYCPSGTSMSNGSNMLAASANTSAGPLASNTWGYNTSAADHTNYLGLSSTPQLVKTAAGPYESGDSTTMQYGILTDFQKPPGSYSVDVVYTVVPLNE